MVLMTMIARVADGLPLAASMQEDEQGLNEKRRMLHVLDWPCHLTDAAVRDGCVKAGRSLMEYQNQAKQLFRKISSDPQPPARCSLESGSLIFHYFIERSVCYLVLCEQSFSKRLAYSFLEDLQTEFSSIYGSKVETVSRPYSFIEFDTYIQKVRKNYMDSRARKNLSSINTELQDVQRIMVQNIDDVLQRGDSLSVLDNKASNLSQLSSKYKKDAKYLNLRSSYAKIAAIVIVIIVFLLFIRYWII